MKTLSIFCVFIFMSYSCVQTKSLGSRDKNVNVDLYKVINIKEDKSLYIVYIQRNDSTFKIVSEKIKENNLDCKMIKKGESYYFDLKVIFPSDTLMGLSVMPNLGIKALKYKESTIYLEDKSHNKLYQANNMNGLCLFVDIK